MKRILLPIATNLRLQALISLTLSEMDGEAACRASSHCHAGNGYIRGAGEKNAFVPVRAAMQRWLPVLDCCGPQSRVQVEALQAAF